MAFDDPAIAKARPDLAVQHAAGQVVTRAGTMLRMAKQGLRDMKETDHDRILLGFLGVVVFGRSMALVMPNLRRYDRKAFESWYAPWRQEMEGDPLMDYFINLRNSVIHEDAPAIAIVLAGYGEKAPPLGSITVDGFQLPERHLGKPIDDASMGNLCRLYVAYLERMFDSFAKVAFAIQDRLIAASRNV